MELELEGVYVPVVTPFDADGELAPVALAAVVERCLSAGVRGIVACGTTGEYYALTEAERIEVMRIHTRCGGRPGPARGRMQRGSDPPERSRWPSRPGTSGTTR